MFSIFLKAPILYSLFREGLNTNPLFPHQQEFREDNCPFCPLTSDMPAFVVILYVSIQNFMLNVTILYCYTTAHQWL
jgi:hypothetical protein